MRINAITVPDNGGEQLARRFAERAGAVEHPEGFEGFELPRPTDGRDTWLVVTRWRDEEVFQAWVASPAFAHGRRDVAAGPAQAAPVSVHSELWSYEVATGAGPPSGRQLLRSGPQGERRPGPR